MKRCEAGKWKEMNDATAAPTFPTCTTSSLQFCDNDFRVAETPDQRKQKSTPEISPILRAEPRSAEPSH